ncbi:MAG: hypothetical protein NW217_15650 [Hyphomicrobiaceae bacterium]|nr:hypothetical protein [Hyphomicrobiaceae bacterium]
MIGLQPFDPWSVLLIAVLNPVVVIVAIAMGRSIDQWQKVIVAGFAASLAGFLALYVMAYFRIVPVKGIGGEAGVFLVQFVLGMIWAWLSWRLAGRQETR